MLENLDIRSVDMNIQQLLRQVRHRLSPTHSELSTTHYASDLDEKFENIDLSPELYYQLDYAARIYDPRPVPENTRLLKLKKTIARMMRVYTTPQVEFNATIFKLISSIVDVLGECLRVFDYFRKAEVRLVQRLENVEEYSIFIASLRRRHEDNEDYIRRVHKYFEEHRERTEDNEDYIRRVHKYFEEHRVRTEDNEDYIRHVNNNVNEQRERVEKVEDIYRQANKRISELEDLKEKLNLALSENKVLRARLDRLAASDSTRQVQPTEAVADSRQSVSKTSEDVSSTSVYNDSFYFPYLNADRGIESEIKKRMNEYVTYFTSMNKSADGPIVDIGCGRGEFIDLGEDAGLKVEGIDVNEDMIEHCKEKGHTVYQQTAHEYLKSCAKESLGGIITCQVIEHMTPAGILSFLRLSSDALQPGGRMIIETPNPRSLAAMSLFTRDFTHQQLFHQQTVKFILEQLGFTRVLIKEQNPAPVQLEFDDIKDEATRENFQKLNDVVFGKLDYCIYAEK